MELLPQFRRPHIGCVPSTAEQQAEIKMKRCCKGLMFRPTLILQTRAKSQKFQKRCPVTWEILQLKLKLFLFELYRQCILSKHYKYYGLNTFERKSLVTPHIVAHCNMCLKSRLNINKGNQTNTVPQLKCSPCPNQSWPWRCRSSSDKSAQLHIIAQPLRCTSQITFVKVSRTPSLGKKKTADVAKPSSPGHILSGSGLFLDAREPWILHAGFADDRGWVESDAQLDVLDSLPSTRYPVRIPAACGGDKSSACCWNGSVFQLCPVFHPKKLVTWGCENMKCDNLLVARKLKLYQVYRCPDKHKQRDCYEERWKVVWKDYLRSNNNPQ